MLDEMWGLAASWVTWQALLVGVAIFLSIIYMTRKRYRLPPGPRPLPLLGNLLAFRGHRINEKLYSWSKQYGPVFTFYIGPICCVAVNTVETAMEVLVHKGADFAGRFQTHTAMITTDGGKDIAAGQYGPIWKLQRRLGLTALKKYLSGPKLEEGVAAALEAVGKEMAEQTAPFEPNKFMSFLVHRVLAAAIFGQRMGMRDPEFEKTMKVVDAFAANFEGLLLEDLIPPLRLWPTTSYRNLLESSDRMNDLVCRNIQQHRDSFDQNDIRDVTDALLFALREEGDCQQLSEPLYVRQVLKDLFVAGLDTSRQTLTITLFFMAAHPDVQKRVQEELDRELGSRRFPRLEDRARLPYTEATLNESLRLGTPVPLGVPHKALKDSTIGDYEVPAGTMVLINHWALHHDEAYWDCLRDFRPERFLCQDGKMAPKPAAWLPFSAGRRVCLGESVARPELLLLLAGLLRSFSFAFPPGEQHHVLERQGNGVALRAPHFHVVATPRE